MEGHTKGPWELIEEAKAYYIMKENETIALVTLGETGKANARLIAAAADLLEAVKTLAAHYSAGRCETLWFSPVWRRAMEAVIKATGEFHMENYVRKGGLKPV